MIARLQLWNDEKARSGPENMAVDECLLQSVTVPLLRVYRWLPGWGSYGYFTACAEAKAMNPGLEWVRRWTGGGIVDHRHDWTYTLVAPRGEPLAEMKGAESYRVIHKALASALKADRISVGVSGPTASAAGGDCFQSPVEYDLLDADGHKIAGAGQRRSREGLLHQGSLSASVDEGFSQRLAECLAEKVRPESFEVDEGRVRRIQQTRYESASWRDKR